MSPKRGMLAITRRKALGWLSAAGSATAVALLGAPGLAYVLDPLLRRSARGAPFRDVGDAAALGAGQPLHLPVIGEKVDAWTRAPEQRLGSVWVRRKGDEVVAFSAECPHLGCGVSWDPSEATFRCPCHESAFGDDGRVLYGPSPRPLDQLEARLRDGRIEVRFARFRTATAERVEIG